MADDDRPTAEPRPVIWWKVSYDFRRPFWDSYGRLAFVKADTPERADARARRLVGILHRGAEIRRLDLTQSDRPARLRFWRLVQANRLWRSNVATCTPNDRRLL